MIDVKKMAEEYVSELIEEKKIPSECFQVVFDSVIFGYSKAMYNLSNIKNSDGVYLIPNPLPIKGNHDRN